MCRFVPSLAQEGLKHRTIKAYLSGIRFSQIQHNTGVTTKPRLPITLDILTKLKTIWQTSTDSTDGAMLWASACIGFFGFFRAGEFTVPTPSTYDPEVHLNLADIAIDSHTAPSCVCVSSRVRQTHSAREWRTPSYRPWGAGRAWLTKFT